MDILITWWSQKSWRKNPKPSQTDSTRRSVRRKDNPKIPDVFFRAPLSPSNSTVYVGRTFWNFLIMSTDFMNSMSMKYLHILILIFRIRCRKSVTQIEMISIKDSNYVRHFSFCSFTYHGIYKKMVRQSGLKSEGLSQKRTCTCKIILKTWKQYIYNNNEFIIL